MPNVDGSVHLPTDVPPGARSMLGGINRRGLVTHGSAGEVWVPIAPHPFAPLQSTPFPKALPSAVAPDAIKPTFVVAINTYSPIAHRNALTDKTPPRAIPGAGVGRPTQRPRPYAMGYATRWPQLAPRWPTWGESPNAAPGR